MMKLKNLASAALLLFFIAAFNLSAADKNARPTVYSADFRDVPGALESLQQLGGGSVSRRMYITRDNDPGRITSQALSSGPSDMGD